MPFELSVESPMLTVGIIDRQ